MLVKDKNMYDIALATIWVDNKAYEAGDERPPVVVTYFGETLVENVDYELEYEESARAGVARVLVKGKGKYVGFARKNYEMLTQAVKIPTGKTGLVYNGSAQTGIAESESYTLKNATETNAGNYEATVSLIDKANCEWSDGTNADKVVSWSIAPAPIVVTPVGAEKIYGASDRTLKATIEGLLKSSDKSKIKYSVSREAGEDAGEYVISAAGDAVQGNYAVEYGTAKFIIQKKDLSSASIMLEKSSYQYTGKRITPAATVRLSGKTLKAGVDYNVTYSNNIDAGTASALVSGIGNYTGSKSRTFTIYSSSGSGSSTGIAIGATSQVGGASYKATSYTTVVYQKGPASKKKAIIPATVAINGRTYQVIGIAAKAFKGTKVKTVVVKATLLTKTSVRKCLKGSKVKTVKVPKAKKAEYRKAFAKKNAGKRVKVK